MQEEDKNVDEEIRHSNDILAYLETRKDELNLSHEEYVKGHPELREILNDFLSSVLLSKPDDVYLFAKEYFHPFNPTPVKDKFFIICGPFGVGKKTLINWLIENYHDLFDLVRSSTTRAKKLDEEDGKHYNFVSDDEFQRRRDNDEFIEVEEHWGSLYGTPHSELERIKGENKIPLIEVDFRGANSFRSYAANFIFIYPPSIPELRKRLAARTDITEDQFKMRISLAIEEIQKANNAVLFTNRIVNDQIDKTKLQLEGLIDALYFQELKDRRGEEKKK